MRCLAHWVMTTSLLILIRRLARWLSSKGACCQASRPEFQSQNTQQEERTDTCKLSSDCQTHAHTHTHAVIFLSPDTLSRQNIYNEDIATNPVVLLWCPRDGGFQEPGSLAWAVIIGLRPMSEMGEWLKDGYSPGTGSFWLSCRLASEHYWHICKVCGIMFLLFLLLTTGRFDGESDVLYIIMD